MSFKSLNMATPQQTDDEERRDSREHDSYEMDSMLNHGPAETKPAVESNNDDADRVALTPDTTCGFWFFRSSCLQVFASKKAYIFVYGMVACSYGAVNAYFGGTISSTEKRFKYPSWISGVIGSAIDVNALCFVLIMSYYGGKGHKQRWTAFGTLCVGIACIIFYLPHALYGPGKEYLDLTKEYGARTNQSQFSDVKKTDTLCHSGDERGCEEGGGILGPPYIFFLAQFVNGMGGCLLDSLGLAYMDDNIEKSKTPFLISLTYFFRMLGPALGYSLASYCLTFYVSPDLTPTITQEDPRWLGAWWLGWIVLAIAVIILATLFAMFPKQLPRAALRKARARKKSNGEIRENVADTPPSFQDMKTTMMRLLKNKPYMCNNLSTVFYFLGAMPYYIFMAKYIEIQYQKAASDANFYTGTVTIVFSAVGIATAGIIITKFQPRARTLAAWSILVAVPGVLGQLAYAFLGCDVPQLGTTDPITGAFNMTTACNVNCNCDYVSFSPICGINNVSFISPCHAGCTDSFEHNNQELFTSCACVPSPERSSSFGTAVSGYCPWDCDVMFYTFIAIVCFNTLLNATARAAEFLVGIRCIDEGDKSVSMGLTQTIICMIAWVPGPIFYGWLIDTACQVWGKTCEGTGNCWLYDTKLLRYRLNFTSTFFTFFGVFFDCIVWYYVKEIKIFDS